jgi:hypothetical protein
MWFVVHMHLHSSIHTYTHVSGCTNSYVEHIIRIRRHTLTYIRFTKVSRHLWSRNIISHIIYIYMYVYMRKFEYIYVCIYIYIYICIYEKVSKYVSLKDFSKQDVLLTYAYAYAYAYTNLLRAWSSMCMYACTCDFLTASIYDGCHTVYIYIHIYIHTWSLNCEYTYIIYWKRSARISWTEFLFWLSWNKTSEINSVFWAFSAVSSAIGLLKTKECNLRKCRILDSWLAVWFSCIH